MHSGERWQLGHRPALDGLRGMAVLMVIVCHVAPGHYLIGGTVGVAAFFALSGFLITSLLLERPGFGKFYARRARRLLPALMVFLFGMLALGVTTPAGVIPPALYFQNYVVIHDRGIGPIVHLWSLSVEEQFYLVWPLALFWFARLLKLQWVLALTVALCALSVLLRLNLLAGGALWTRIYCASDTNACLLLAGCSLALALKAGVIRPIPLPVGMLAILGLLVLGLVPSSTAAYAVAPIEAALLAVIAILGVIETQVTPKPLVLVGQRSYALYLWHYPLVTVIAERLPVAHWLSVVVMLAASWAATELSWRLVEGPVLGQRRPPRWRQTVPILNTDIRHSSSENVVVTTLPPAPYTKAST